MYHYVRPFNNKTPYLNHLEFDDFCRQLDYFEQTFGFVSKEEFQKCFYTKRVPKGIVLTFDDGLSCHYNFVFQELKRRGLWGIFYINTHPIEHLQMLDVHKIHMLLAKNNPSEVLEFIEGQDSYRRLIDDDKIGIFSKSTYKNQISTEDARRVKQYLNYFTKPNERTRLIDRIANHFLDPEDTRADLFYLNPEQIATMHKEGMVIGSHTASHPVLSNLGKTEQYYEIHHSIEFMVNNIGIDNVSTFCYPYGGRHNYNHSTLGVLKDLDIEYAFSVEQRDVSSVDLGRRYELPRYDCNQFPYGTVRRKMT